MFAAALSRRRATGILAVSFTRGHLECRCILHMLIRPGAHAAVCETDSPAHSHNAAAARA